MKKLFFLIMVAAIFVAFYEQNTPEPNIFITCIALLIFMYGMLKLSANTVEFDKQNVNINDNFMLKIAI